MDMVTDSSYDLIKLELEKILNESEKLKSKLYDTHSQKVEDNINKVKVIKDAIVASSTHLIHLVRSIERRLMKEAMNIEFILNDNLTEIISECKRTHLEAQIKETKTILDKNQLSELQLKKLTNEFISFNSDLAYKIDQISRYVF